VAREFEKDASGIIGSFGVQNQAILDILSGKAEPSGLLPFQMPDDMTTVELQDEDIPHDMICYTDAAGHTYDFGFGMNWKGVINDTRTRRYVNRIIQPIISAKGTTITISSATNGAKIYYSMDGSTPSFIKENEYSKPFTAEKGSTIKAIAKVYGVDNSNLVVYNVK
jgi:beta-glucosidase